MYTNIQAKYNKKMQIKFQLLLENEHEQQYTENTLTKHQPKVN